MNNLKSPILTLDDVVKNVNIFQVDFNLSEGHFYFEFISDAGTLKVKNACKKFKALTFETKINRNEVKDEFFSYLKQHGIDYAIPSTTGKLSF